MVRSGYLQLDNEVNKALARSHHKHQAKVPNTALS